MTPWIVARFAISTEEGPHDIEGFTAHGLGLNLRRPIPPGSGVWGVTHLNSGHLIALIIGTVERAKELAGELATACDWSYSMPGGWRNVDPGLPVKLKDWLDRHHHEAGQEPDMGSHADGHDVARGIAASRD